MRRTARGAKSVTTHLQYKNVQMWQQYNAICETGAERRYLTTACYSFVAFSPNTSCQYLTWVRVKTELRLEILEQSRQI